MSKKPHGDDKPPQKQYQPKKKCPVCGAMVKGLPFHIEQEHGQ